MATSPKRVRKILPAEFTKLSALGAEANASFEGMEDARLVFNEKKAAYETARTPYLRHVAFLVKKHRVKEGEQIDPDTGEIHKTPARAPAAAPPGIRTT